MKLSIIVPVYNMARNGMLEFCLESLIKQSIDDYEIIAVDDASTDLSLDILKRYEKQYPEKIKAIASPCNQKQGGAKNIGLSYASGEWIAFVDSDDWVAPNMYQLLLEEADRTGADMVACNYSLTKEHSFEIGEVVRTHSLEQTGMLDEERYRKLILHSGSLVVKIYQRHLIMDCGMKFPEHIFYEDNAIANAIIRKVKKFAYIDEALYFYYQHDSSTVHTVTKERCKHRMKAADLMLAHAKEEKYYESYQDEIDFKYLNLYYVNTLFSYLQHGSDFDISFISSLLKKVEQEIPNFTNNPYYRNLANEEQRKFIALQQKSTLLMLGYYKLVQFVRMIKKKSKLAILLAAFIATIATMFSLYQPKAESYDVVLLGDSVIGNYNDVDGITNLLIEETGLNIFNGAFGGSSILNNNTEEITDLGTEVLSIEVLVPSIVTKDFSVQLAARDKIALLDFFEERMMHLSDIDFSETKILVIGNLVNDYSNQYPIEEVMEVLEESILSLQKAYPDLEIWLNSPTYNYIIDIHGEKHFSDEYTLGEYNLEDYLREQRALAEKLEIGYIDNYYHSVITKETIDEYTLDGLHLNGKGRAVVANNMLELIF